MKRARPILMLFTAGLLSSPLSCDRIFDRPGVACQRDTDCTVAQPRCDLVTKLCVEAGDAGSVLDGGADLAPACTAATAAVDCAEPGAPICESASCRACSGAGDDAACAARSAATPRCKASGSNAGRCVACLPSTPISESAGCSASAPVCSEEGACRGCQTHAECASGVCRSDGACALAADVAYVDNKAMTSGCITGDGTRPSPYCELQEAIAGSKAFVLVAGHGDIAPYRAAEVITARTVIIVGPGKAAAQGAVINQTGFVAISVAPGAGLNAQVTLDGLQLIGSNVGARAGAACSGTAGTANLTLRNMLIHSSGGAGVEANACALNIADSQIGRPTMGNLGAGVSASGGTVTVTGTTITGSGGAGVSASGGTVTLARSILQGNPGGGLRITDGNYLVENNLIAGSGVGLVAGVVFSGSVTGTFWFNTVVGNQTSSGVGGVNCNGVLNGTPLVQASIFRGNSQVGGASTVGCNATHSNLDDSPTPAGAGNFSGDPLFVDTVGYRLQSTSPCKDKVLATDLVGTAIPTVDIDGEQRPAGTIYDVGADER